MLEGLAGLCPCSRVPAAGAVPGCTQGSSPELGARCWAQGAGCWVPGTGCHDLSLAGCTAPAVGGDPWPGAGGPDWGVPGWKQWKQKAKAPSGGWSFYPWSCLAVRGRAQGEEPQLHHHMGCTPMSGSGPCMHQAWQGLFFAWTLWTESCKTRCKVRDSTRLLASCPRGPTVLQMWYLCLRIFISLLN